MSRLHRLKNAGHAHFDLLWVYKLYHCGKTPQYWRNKTYRWLAKKMGIPRKDCHFSTMTAEQIKKATDICAEEFANSDKLLTFVDKVENGQIPELQWFVQKYKRSY